MESEYSYDPEVDHLVAAIASIYTDTWRDKAVCFQSKIDFFNEIDEAKQVCVDCPVKTKCLDDALFYEDEGVRGGLSFDERISYLLYRKRNNPYFVYDLNLALASVNEQ
jgi:hypothetical protein